MKRTLIILFLAGLFGALQAVAQTTPATDAPAADNGTLMNRRGQLANTTPEQRAERQTAQMKKRLSLSAEQETTVAAVNLKYAQQMQSLMGNGGRNRDTMKQVRDLADSKDGELKKVFTSDQYKQYETYKDEQKDRMKQARGLRGSR